MAEVMGRRCNHAKPNRFKAGSLKDRIVIEAKTLSRDSFGQPIETWATFASIWADVLFQNGKTYNLEAVNANKETAQTNASMRILWRLDITTAMRVKFRGDIYDIKAILPSSDHDYVDLAVVTGVNNG